MRTPNSAHCGPTRSSRHHYLKGSLRCGRCGGRVGWATSKGNGGDYEYFFCIGRHKKTTDCDLPYVSALDVEDAVEREWSRVRLTDDEIAEFSDGARAEFSDGARAELHRSAESNSRLLADQKRRLTQLTHQKERLFDAYMAGAIPVEDLNPRQTRLSAEIADAKRLLHNAQEANEEVLARLEAVLALLRHAEALYKACGPEGRQLLNEVVFGPFKIDVEDQDESRVPAVPDAPLLPVIQAVIDSRGQDARTPGERKLTEGSNVTHLAEVEGFEPSMGL